MFMGAVTRHSVIAAVLLFAFSVSTGAVHSAPLSPGDVLVADQGGFIYHYSATGADLGIFVGGLASPSWVAIDRNGSVYVSEYTGARVQKFSPFGVQLLTITTTYTPGGVAVGSDGTIYVAHYDGGAIQRYSPSGTDLGLFASYECDPGCGTDFIKLGLDGNLYVGDFQPASEGTRHDGLVRVLSSLGEDLGNFLEHLGQGRPEGLAFDARGNLYVGNFLTFSITRFSPDALELGTFATLGGVGSAYGLAFDGVGALYAANYAGGSIHKFSASGLDLEVFASAGLVLPRDLAIVPGPVSADQCKHGGWEVFEFPRVFRNQGDCIAFVETGR
jgi:outer membrane protein assembly factor BamB